MKNRAKHPKLSGNKTLITEFAPVIKQMERDRTIEKIRPEQRKETENGHTDPVSIVNSDGKSIQIRFSAPNCHQDVFVTTEDPEGFENRIPTFNQQMVERFARKNSPRT